MTGLSLACKIQSGQAGVVDNQVTFGILLILSVSLVIGWDSGFITWCKEEF